MCYLSPDVRLILQLDLRIIIPIEKMLATKKFMSWTKTENVKSILLFQQKLENPTIVHCREEPRSSAVHPLLHFFTLPNSSQLTLVIFKIQRIRFLMLVKFRFSEKTRKFEKTFPPLS